MDKRVARFDGWRVDFDSGEISKDGKTSRLQDQPLQILDELLERPGEVVTREQLIARLWPKGVVEFDTGLNSAMRKLRVALGDDAETPRYIETLPRKGYRFVGHLEPEPPAAQIPTLPAEYVPTPFETGAVIGRRASDRRAPYVRLALGLGSILVAIVLGLIAWQLPAGGWFGGPRAAVAKARPTVVVLPLRDMSLDHSSQPLCDGLTEELSNWLAHIPSLNVVARTSAFAFKDKDADVRDIGRALGATHVLEGSLRRSQDQLRITVQLIEAEKGLHMWSRSFDLPIGDIFTIEDTVSRAVAEALHLELAADTDEVWSARQPDRGKGFTEAYEYYLLGRARQRQRTAEDNLKAVEYFRQAAQAEPNYALALVGLSESLLNGLSLNHTPLEDVVAEVEPLINRALAIEPNLADALAVKGWLRTEQFRYDEALPLLQSATAANPNDASSHRFLGNLYDRSAQPAKALEHYSISARLDPMDSIAHVFRCMELVDVGEFEEAAAACVRAQSLAQQGRKDAAAAALVEARAHGWRGEWLARRDPYLAGVEIPAGK
jgi:TolB-like protein/DNA-binding winged helix-turn-helix (wHTH) protein